MWTLNTSASPAQYASYGAQLTASGSTHTMGSWAQLDGSGGTPIAAECLMLQTYSNSAATDMLFDVGIDAGGGSVRILAQNLMLTGFMRRTTAQCSDEVALPLHVPRGSVLVARMQAGTASATCSMKFRIGQNVGGVPGFARCFPLTATANSRGVAVDAGGTANTKVRTQLVASTSERALALMALIGPNADIACSLDAVLRLDLETGASGSELIIWPDVILSRDTRADIPRATVLPVIAYALPASSRLSASLLSDTTTTGDRTIDLVLYGFA
jgi:hypothetical protein